MEAKVKIHILSVHLSDGDVAVINKSIDDARSAGIREVVEQIPQLITKVKKAMWEDDWGIKGVIYTEQLDAIVLKWLQAFKDKLKE